MPEDPAITRAKQLWQQKQPREAMLVLVRRIEDLNTARRPKHRRSMISGGCLGVVLTVIVAVPALWMIANQNDKNGGEELSSAAITETSALTPDFNVTLTALGEMEIVTQTAIFEYTPHPTLTPTPTAIPEPELGWTPIFEDQLTQLLEKGTLLDAMTSQGVNYPDYQQQLAQVKGAYSLASAAWPTDFAPDAQEQFGMAFVGWDLALLLWEMKIEEKDNPFEPDINGYSLFVEYAGDNLIVETYPTEFCVVQYCGKKFLPFDDNIGILFGLASGYFENGQKLVLAEWPE